jgi:TolB-like protein
LNKVAYILLIFFFLSACSTSSKLNDTLKPVSSTQPLIQTVRLNEYSNIDSVLLEASKYIINRINTQSIIAVVSINAETRKLSEYSIDSVTMHLVNENSFTIIERMDINQINKELLYQYSGEVSDETAVSIGKKIGAKYIITGSIVSIGNKYSLRIKILDVESAENIGTKIYQFNQDQTLVALLKLDEQSKIDPVEKNIPANQEQPRQNIINGDINIINNNTTTINGDVFVNMPDGLGW